MNNNSKKIVYLGIDVHKRTYSVTAISDKQVIKKATMPAVQEVLLSFIQKNFPNATVNSAYEAGFSGFGLHRFLVTNKINNMVIHAGSVKIAINNRAKTDKRDSQKIAQQLSEDDFQSVNIPSEQRECWRAITRVRAQLVKRKAQTSCQIKALLYYFGILPHNHSKRTSKKWLIGLLILKDSIDSDVFFSLKTLIDLWLYLNQRIKETEKRVKEQAKEDFVIGNVYKETPGIGLISSRILANELGNLSQFCSQSALFSFTGLTPKEYSSGEHTRKGNISHMGNPMIRAILTESAWKAIKKDKKLGETYERLLKNTGSKKKAIVGIARKMIGIVRAKLKKVRINTMH